MNARGTSQEATTHRPVALDRVLRTTSDIKSAAQTLMDYLVDIGLPLPSLYIERGGRLRCLAMHGYWQVHDGFPPNAGVIGATYSAGTPIQTHPEASADYIQAAPDVEFEVAVPLYLAGRVIGVLNVESRTALPPDCRDILTDCGRRFVDRVEALGGMPPDSPAQRLVRHVTRLSQLDDAEQIEQQTLAAATDLVAMSSAFMVRPDPADTARVVASRGPLAQPFADMNPADVRAIASWVGSGTSCYTMGDPSGTGFAGNEGLRAAGIATVIAIPLAAGGTQLGLLVVADAERMLPETDDVERLELLATQAASGLLTAAAMGELRDRAARDPLTGLGHSGSFQAALGRARRLPEQQLAVLMIDIDGFKAINDARGHLAGDEIIVDMSRALAAALRDGDSLYRVGGDEFAAVLEVSGADDALNVAKRLCSAAAATGIATASVGVALAQPDESDEELMQRADMALYEVKAGGRANVKLARGSGYGLLTPRQPGAA